MDMDSSGRARMRLPTADLPPDCALLRDDRIALIRWSGGRFLTVCDRARSIRPCSVRSVQPLHISLLFQLPHYVLPAHFPQASLRPDPTSHHLPLLRRHPVLGSWALTPAPPSMGLAVGSPLSSPGPAPTRAASISSGSFSALSAMAPRPLSILPFSCSPACFSVAPS